VNERILANILSKLYRDYSLRERFFLAGKGEAASFALHYAFRYPQAVDGVSAIDASSYPSGVSSGDFPILVIVESEDEEAIEAASMFMKSLNESGTQTRLLEIENIGSEIPYSVQRLTVELFEQVSQ
jgi:pimeloyl-ACP methyl ester carboxylesterase